MADAKEGEETCPWPRDATDAEKTRDKVIAFMDGPAMFRVNIANIIVIIVDGAFYFFLMVGWQAMCTPVMDCQPRNWWLNWSIQLLNVCFTYGAIVSFPWRAGNFHHLFLGSRSNADGHDFYGRETEEIWFHIPRRHRRRINLIFLFNNFAQYANQVTRIVYPTYAAANVFPANIWTGVFFGLAFLAAGVGAGYLARQETLLRRAHPERFPDPLADGLRDARAWYEGESPKPPAPPPSARERMTNAVKRLASTNGFETHCARKVASFESTGSVA